MSAAAVSAALRAPVLGRALVAAVAGIVLAACAPVRLVSDYDEATDRALTALQQSADDFIAQLAAGAPAERNAFDRHRTFYDDADRQLRRLEFRVGSIPKNDRTVKLVNDIRASLLGAGQCSEEGASLKDLHCLPDNRARGPSKRALEIARRNVNQTIGAALALELAKKQGLEQNR